MSTPFDALPLSEALLSVARELGFHESTAVQAASIPVLLAGGDLIGQSKTGSGKTAAFVLPILQGLRLQERAPQALVLCPTRELGAQIAREFRKWGRHLPGLQVRTIAGGESMRDQIGALRKGVHLVVGTPGRVLDHLRRGNLKLQTVKTLVLDEADRMLEMGFQADIEDIVSQTPAERQTVFFSATFPPSIEEMSRRHQRDAVRVTIEETEAVAPILHQKIEVPSEEKLDALRWALGKSEYESAIVFCNLKATVNEVHERLHLDGASVDCLHGDLEQYERDQVMALFRNQSVRILIATDVAARGIDVDDLDLVVNFELPQQEEIYVHRIGRTGRAGRKGLALSIVNPRESAALAGYLNSTEMESLSWQPASPRPGLTRSPLMQTIRIAGGRKDKVRPGDILGALTGEAGGLSGADIGKIEIHDRFSYVAVRLALSSGAVRSLSNGKIKGRSFKVALVS